MDLPALWQLADIHAEDDIVITVHWNDLGHAVSGQMEEKAIWLSEMISDLWRHTTRAVIEEPASQQGFLKQILMAFRRGLILI